MIRPTHIPANLPGRPTHRRIQFRRGIPAWQLRAALKAMNMRIAASVHLGLAAIVLTLVAPMDSGRAEDVVFFDEDDSAGSGYYDASLGVTDVARRSQLTLGGPGDKMIVVTEASFTGSDSGLLEWKTGLGGDWSLFVARPGWVTADISDHTNLVVYLNGPVPVPALQLPRLSLESSPPDLSSPEVSLADYLPAGVDDTAETWQEVRIPLADFEPFGNFDPQQVKSVRFRAGVPDNTTRTLWIDNLRFEGGPGGNEPGPPPPPPVGVVAFGGDRSVIVQWEDNRERPASGYRVYRSDSEVGPFVPAHDTTVTWNGFADLDVANGTTYWYEVRAVDDFDQTSQATSPVSTTPQPFANDRDFLDYLQRAAFGFFWFEANPSNGLVPDRSQPASPASVAAVGFGLTAVGIGIEHGWISREAGRQRCLTTLQTFGETPQGSANTGTIGHQGWFYHFLDRESATRFGTSELSSIDTALFLAGVLYSRQYFGREDPDEAAIRTLADSIFRRVDWWWMTDGQDSLSHGWRPDSGFIVSHWQGYNEAMILYLLGLGSPVNPLPSEFWNQWTSGYTWDTRYGLSFVSFPPLFGHQYSHCWIDFRHITDVFTRNHYLTYFENSRRATLAQQAYAEDNPGGFAGYGESVWGFTACDGPGNPPFHAYIARGAPPGFNDDGTIAPTAAGGSLPFAPEIALPTLRHLYDAYREDIWTAYGFRDAFNLQAEWWGPDVLGIDQGPILLMAENWRDHGVWRQFMRDPIIQRGLEAAGFTAVKFEHQMNLTPDKDAGAWALNWNGALDTAYQVEYADDLTRWHPSPTGFRNPIDSPSTLRWEDTGPPATATPPNDISARFYRIFQITSSTALP